MDHLNLSNQRLFKLKRYSEKHGRNVECNLTRSFQEPSKQITTKTPVLSSVVQIRAKEETPGVKNNLAEPEYDFLSKQPTEVIDETYKVRKSRSRRDKSKGQKETKRERERK